jgi:RNA polymerase sigma-70 factor (ECF subfamily)
MSPSPRCALDNKEKYALPCYDSECSKQEPTMMETRMEPGGSGDVDALVESAQSGDGAANEALFRRFYPVVFALAHWYLPNRDEALDATQDVFVKAIRGIRTYHHTPGCFGAWLARITRHHCINIIKRRRVAMSLNELQETGQELVSYELLPEEQAIAAQGRECLLTAVARLSPTRQAVFLLHHVHQYSYTEIAAFMGCAVGTVGAHLYQACAILRDDPNLQAWYAATKDRE